MTKALEELFRRASLLSESRHDDPAAAKLAEIEADDEPHDRTR